MTETDETHARQSTKNEEQPEQHTRLETRNKQKENRNSREVKQARCGAVQTKH